MIKIIPSTKKVHYNEISQPQTITFSLATTEYDDKANVLKVTELFPKIKCRDFLCDVVKAEKEKSPVSIFGFTFNPKETPLTPGKYTLIVSIPSKDELEAFLDNIEAVNEFERSIRYERSFIIRSENKNNELILECDPRWRDTAWKISLHTWLLRLATYPIRYQGRLSNWFHNLAHDAPRTDEIMRFKSLLPKLQELMQEFNEPRDETKYNKMIEGGISQWHNYSGIVGYLTHRPLPANPVIQPKVEKPKLFSGWNFDQAQLEIPINPTANQMPQP